MFEQPIERLRKVLGPVALALVLVQTVLPAASGAGCCAGASTRTHTSVEGEDCCPAGSHAPGMCPLKHSANRRAGSPADCRLSCAASSQAALVLPSGVLPLSKPALAPLMTVAIAPAIASPVPIDRFALPNAPPPKAS